jgi:hypothetical protein
MSKVKIEGNASGTGTFTLTTPNSNTDRTFTLPDATGDLLTSNSDLPAANLIGDIPAGNLVGSLPAIDGSALTGVSGGKILQVVFNHVDTIASYYIDSTTPDTTQQIAALNTSITPTASDSKILVTFSFCGEGHWNNVWRLYRGGTEIGRSTQNTNYWTGFKPANYDPDVNTTPTNHHFVYVDSPATTSSINYNIRAAESTNTNYSFRLNRSYGGSDAGQAQYEIGTSQVILMEIGA